MMMPFIHPSRNTRLIFPVSGQNLTDTVVQTLSRSDTEPSFTSNATVQVGVSVSANKLRKVLFSTRDGHTNIVGHPGRRLKPLIFLEGLRHAKNTVPIPPAALAYRRPRIQASLAKAIERAENEGIINSARDEKPRNRLASELSLHQKYRVRQALQRLPVRNEDLRCLNEVSEKVGTRHRLGAEGRCTIRRNHHYHHHERGGKDAEVGYAARIFENQKLSETLLLLAADQK